MPQLDLIFTNKPTQKTRHWEQLNAQQKQVVLEAISRLLIKASQPNPKESSKHE